MQATSARRLLAFSVLGAGIALVPLSGCGGSAYTRQAGLEHRSKMDVMKSATEYDMARQAYFAGDLHKAIKRVETSIAINDQVPKSHVLRGRILLEMSELDGALDALHTAETLAPDNVDAHYFLGLTYERLGEHDEAFKHYAAAAELEPEKAQYVVAVAEVLIDDGRVDDAEEYILSRRSRFDHNAGVRQTLGHIALMKNDPARALVMFSEARMLAPEDNEIVEDLAQTQIRLGRFGEAAGNLARLLKDKDFAAQRRDLRHAYGRCLMELGRYIDARDVYLSLTDSGEGESDVDAWIGLGNVACIINDPFRVRTAAGRVMALAPEREEGYLFRSMWHRRRGEHNEALRWLEVAANQTGGSSAIYSLAGLVLADMGRTEDARQVLSAVMAERARPDAIATVPEAADN